MGQLIWYRKGIDLVYEGDYGQIIKGFFNATTSGAQSEVPYGGGMRLTPSRTWIERGNADDGGVVLSGSGAAYLFGGRRLLLTAAQTGNNSFYGGSDQLSVNADVGGVTAHIAGHWGFLEMKPNSKVNIAGAVRGQADCPSTATISGVLSTFMAASDSLAGTHNGPAVALHVTNPVVGAFDAAEYFGTSGNDSTGCIDAGGNKSTMGTVAKWKKVNVAGTVYFAPLYADKTT